MIAEVEQFTQDIDWFFTDGENIGFIASAGGKLPQSVSSSEEKNQLLISYFKNLPAISDIVINPKLKEILSIKKIDDRYLSDFANMAAVGLYSFDKTVLNIFSDDNYHLVAKPKNPLKLSRLPSEIFDSLIATVIKDKMSDKIKVSSIT